MLDWLKRIATPAPRDQLVKDEHRAPPTEDPVERLVGRLGTYGRTTSELAPRSSQMCVIVVASQKGGVGKTTIAAHLAVRAGLEGNGPVALVDTDPQGSLSEWWDARKDELAHDDDNAPSDGVLSLATVKLEDLATKLAELRKSGAAVAIIDTPPALTASIKQVIEIADLGLIPARPSPHDLRAIGATVNMTRRAGKPFVFITTGAAPHANNTSEPATALCEHGRVAPVILYQRTDYAGSMIDGRTVMEAATTGRSAQEIAELWKHVYAQINMRAAA